MKVALSTIGKFHTFDLARQLQAREMLAGVFTGYPRYKLTGEGLPPELIHSFPWVQTVFMARGRFGLGGPGAERALAWLATETLDSYAAAHLPECDVFLGLSGSGLKTGRAAQACGAAYVCDRGSSHIRYQDANLRDEFACHGQTFVGVDPRVIAKEEAEYAQADAITVPSSFVWRSFVEMGVPERKLRLVPYGVNLSRFAPVGQPDPDTFEVLFVGGASLRKGIPYLLESFRRLRHPCKRLTLVGTTRPEVEKMIADAARELPIVRHGHCPQPQLKEIMSRSHVMVLPSIEEGLALVQAQAMACGCPVIGTTNTGAEDLFTNGVEGYVVPVRDAAAIADRLQTLADDPAWRAQMAAASLARVQSFGGWDTYGSAMASVLTHLHGSFREAVRS